MVRYTDEGSGCAPTLRPLIVATVAGSTPKRTNAPLPLFMNASTVPGPAMRRVRSGKVVQNVRNRQLGCVKRAFRFGTTSSVNTDAVQSRTHGRGSAPSACCRLAKPVARRRSARATGRPRCRPCGPPHSAGTPIAAPRVARSLASALAESYGDWPSGSSRYFSYRRMFWSM